MPLVSHLQRKVKNQNHRPNEPERRGEREEGGKNKRKMRREKEGAEASTLPKGDTRFGEAKRV